jgi:hypothetical protein
MKRGISILIVVLTLLYTSHAINLGTARGYVLDTNSNPISGASVSIAVNDCTGSGCSATDTTDANGFYIETNLNIVPGDNITVTATSGSASNFNSGIATGSGSVGVASVNVSLCTTITPPTLTPVSDSHSTTATMTWTTFKTGSEYDEFVFNGGTPNSSANSPQVRTGLSYGAYTWQVRTCSTLCCTDYETDAFTVTNNAPQRPSLVDQGHTQSTTLSLEWTNYTDSDGDATYNQFYLSTDASFSTVVDSDTAADSPKTTSNTTSFTFYYWRVRTCDTFGACSGYSNDTFFVYSCPASIVSGGTKTEEVNVSVSCTPSWSCQDWGTCGSGLSTRNCFDINNCVDSIPKEYQVCAYQAPQLERPASTTEREFFLGDFRVSDVLQGNLGIDEEWMFKFNEEDHLVKIISINGNDLIIEIRSEPRQYRVPFDGSTTADIDGDGIDDVVVKVVKSNHQTVSLAFELLTKPEERLPLNAEFIVQQLKEGLEGKSSLVIFLLVIVGALIVIVIYQHQKYVVRELKVDKKLSEYVATALGKGFSEDQIRLKLASTGFAEEEIDYVFRKLPKKKN